MLWDQWCKKLFLSNAAWLTFPADKDKRMRVSRPFCVFVYLRVCSWLDKRKRGGMKINEIIDVTCQM